MQKRLFLDGGPTHGLSSRIIDRHVLDIFQTGAPHSAHRSGCFLGTRVGQ